MRTTICLLIEFITIDYEYIMHQVKNGSITFNGRASCMNLIHNFRFLQAPLQGTPITLKLEVAQWSIHY